MQQAVKNTEYSKYKVKIAKPDTDSSTQTQPMNKHLNTDLHAIPQKVCT